MQTIPGFKRVAMRFKDYNRDMKDVWQSFGFIDFYVSRVAEELGSGEETYVHEPLTERAEKKLQRSRDGVLGVASHIQRVVNPERSFLVAVALTEDFLKDLATTVYTEYPQKLASRDAIETPESQFKLLEVVLARTTREEILESLIEEKVRGIFYGNPIDFFTKEKKLKLGFEDYFTKEHSENLDIFREITARRNVFAHNRGRVDAKYCREVKNSQFEPGKKAVITREYLKSSIVLLRGLAAVAASLVNRNTFGQGDVRGTLAKAVGPFERRYSDSARAG